MPPRHFKTVQNPTYTNPRHGIPPDAHSSVTCFTVEPQPIGAISEPTQYAWRPGVPPDIPYPQHGTSSFPTFHSQDMIGPSTQAGMPPNRVSLHPQPQATSQPVRAPSHAPPPGHTHNRGPAMPTHPQANTRPPSQAHAQTRAPTTSMHPPTLQQRFQSTQAPPRFPPEHEEVARRVNAAARQRGIAQPPRGPLPFPETPPQPVPTRLLSGVIPYPEMAKQEAQRKLDSRARDHRR